MFKYLFKKFAYFTLKLAVLADDIETVRNLTTKKWIDVTQNNNYLIRKSTYYNLTEIVKLLIGTILHFQT